MIRRLKDYGNFFFICDVCEKEEDSGSNKIYGIKLPTGWEVKEIKVKSQEGTNITQGCRHLCEHCE